MALGAALLAGCAGEVEPEIVAGVDACRQCSMVIDRPHEACGFVHGGEFVTFDSPVCLLQRHEALRRESGEPPERVWFADYRDGTLHPAEAMTFLLTDHLPTTMEGGVLAFAEREAALAASGQPDEILTDWEGFRLLRGDPDRMLEVRIGGEGMVPEVVEATKGEIVLWRARGADLESDLVVSIGGYPEIGDVTLPASGEEVSFRMRALRPGDGFPIVRVEDGEPLGRLRVHGAHTAEEEAM
jgi:hypothetical protein